MELRAAGISTRETANFKAWISSLRAEIDGTVLNKVEIAIAPGIEVSCMVSNGVSRDSLSFSPSWRHVCCRWSLVLGAQVFEMNWAKSKIL